MTADVVSAALSATHVPIESTSFLRVRNGSLRVLLARSSDVVVHMASDGGSTEMVGPEVDESGSFSLGGGTAVLGVVAEHASVNITVEA